MKNTTWKNTEGHQVILCEGRDYVEVIIERKHENELRWDVMLILGDGEFDVSRDYVVLGSKYELREVKEVFVKELEDTFLAQGYCATTSE